MNRKRSICNTYCSDAVLVESTNTILAQAQQQQQQKRCCGTALHPAPGELKADDVTAYLRGLSGHLSSSHLHQAASLLDDAGWRAFAELNMLLGRCLATDALPEQLLLNYSRFTLQPRAQLQQRYSQYAASKAKLTSHQMALLHFLLEWMLAQYPDCALTELTLQLPPWMVSWASRWGLASSSNRISLIRLDAYPTPDPASSNSSACRQPGRVLYMPAVML